jgi:ABC-type multidrug transport system ATPase subunit
VLANGLPLTQERRCAIMSYVAQEDTLMGQLTVLETLRTAARFVHGYSLSRAAFEACVREAVVRMGLVSCQDTLVGDIFRKGISGGQKRRLSIAIELISQPSCLLLDEPTSGLESASALAVVRLLRRLAAETRVTVITTTRARPGTWTWSRCRRTGTGSRHSWFTARRRRSRASTVSLRTRCRTRRRP